MGYDLRLCAVSDEQLAYLRAHAQYTRDFIEGRRPTLTKTEKVGSWFSKREVERRVEVDVGCVWPESAAACRTLYSGGLSISSSMELRPKLTGSPIFRMSEVATEVRCSDKLLSWEK